MQLTRQRFQRNWVRARCIAANGYRFKCRPATQQFFVEPQLAATTAENTQTNFICLRLTSEHEPGQATVENQQIVNFQIHIKPALTSFKRKHSLHRQSASRCATVTSSGGVSAHHQVDSHRFEVSKHILDEALDVLRINSRCASLAITVCFASWEATTAKLNSTTDALVGCWSFLFKFCRAYHLSIAQKHRTLIFKLVNSKHELTTNRKKTTK